MQVKTHYRQEFKHEKKVSVRFIKIIFFNP